MKFSGKVIRYRNNVDTDVIIPARYLNTSDKAELAKHCMEDIDTDFAKKIRNGAKIIVAGQNFGCGSSREHAPAAIKASGIDLVIAESFARIFYRNAINIGLAIVELPELCKITEESDEIVADMDSGAIENKTKGKAFSVAPFPPFIQAIIEAGGLLNSLKTEGEK
ncbi:MAG TPA: 3-isopropylmalate dehydratase small subunit [Ruminococcaceae bacterium]|nr:3-isopropylmalate dehydratase small subunit [Oscillospiraceae bacterium]